MNICTITYKECGNDLYSEEGLKLLSKDLENLKLFPYTHSEQIREALTNVSNLNHPGTSQKLNANLNIKTECFELTDTNSRFIIKPQNTLYTQIPLPKQDRLQKLVPDSFFFLGIPWSGW